MRQSAAWTSTSSCPAWPDKKFAYALAKTHYKSLLDSGVKISEWTPGFVHAKVFVVDDREAVVGTINLDYRSLYHHFENAVWLTDAACIRDIETDFQDDAGTVPHRGKRPQEHLAGAVAVPCAGHAAQSAGTAAVKKQQKNEAVRGMRAASFLLS